MFLSEGQPLTTGAPRCPRPLPKAMALLGDRGYDADWFRNPLEMIGVLACIPSGPPKVRSRADQTFTASITTSRTCSPNSRTGAASQPATTAAPTPFMSRHLHRCNRSLLALIQ